MPEPVAFYPLNARYKAAEKENRQPKGILSNVGITNGPYNEPGGAYMFYGTISSYIEIPNREGLDPQLSITLMCWVQPGGQDGSLFLIESSLSLEIDRGNFVNRMVMRTKSSEWLATITTGGVLPAGKWVHVAASYDASSGNNSLYINGRLRASRNIGRTRFRKSIALQRVYMGGASSFNKYFKGKIAEMKVYDVALNEAQIQTSMRQGSRIFFPKSFSHYFLWCFLLLIIFPLLNNFARGR